MTREAEPWCDARDLEAAVQRVAGLLVRVYGAAPSEETGAQARRLTLAALDWPSVRRAGCVWGNPDCHEERHLPGTSHSQKEPA